MSKIGYLPIIDSPATEMSTINAILIRSYKIADLLELKYLTLVFDEAIYAKIQQIRWKNHVYKERFIVRLGEFHLVMSFCGAIGKLFKDAGLKVHNYCCIIYNEYICILNCKRYGGTLYPNFLFFFTEHK